MSESDNVGVCSIVYLSESVSEFVSEFVVFKGYNITWMTVRCLPVVWWRKVEPKSEEQLACRPFYTLGSGLLA